MSPVNVPLYTGACIIDAEGSLNRQIAMASRADRLAECVFVCRFYCGEFSRSVHGNNDNFVATC